MIHFRPEEVVGLQPRLVGMLDEARTIAGVPFQITSGLRTAAENRLSQGVDNSAHLRGLGVDLACSDPQARFFMLVGLMRVGFRRLGIYDHHVHADCDDSLPQNVVWTGISHP